MKTEMTQLRTDIYCAIIFATLALAVSFTSGLIGLLLAAPIAAAVGFFIGWLDAPVWGRIVLVAAAATGFVTALLVRGAQGIVLRIALLFVCILLGSMVGIARGNAHDKNP